MVSCIRSRQLQFCCRRYYSIIATIVAVYFFIQYQMCSLQRLVDSVHLSHKRTPLRLPRRRSVVEDDIPQPCLKNKSPPEDPIFCKYADEIATFNQPKYLPRMRSPCFYHTARQSLEHSQMQSSEGKNASRYLFCLPSIYIVGVAKSGTTDLFTHLLQHQHVIAPVHKEPHFWDNIRIKSTRNTWKHYLDNYEMLSDLMQHCYLIYNETRCQGLEYSKKQAKDWKISLNGSHITTDLQRLKMQNASLPYVTIDATTTYISAAYAWQTDFLHRNMTHHNEPMVIAPHRIKHYVPDAKIIILLRNPTERLISDFYFFVSGKLQRTASYFHKAVVNGVKWWDNCTSVLSEYRCAFGENYNGTSLPNLGSGLFSWGDSIELGDNGAARLRVGMYIIYIEAWLKIFPRKQLYIDTIENCDLTTLQNSIFPFLGLAQLSGDSYKRLKELEKEGPKNKSKTRKRQVFDETRLLLDEVYRPYNIRLADLLNDRKFLFKDDNYNLTRFS